MTRQHRDKPGLVGLYQRIKHGVDGNRAGDRSCSILQVLEALVPYRNGVFGHGAVRFESFYAQDMGPLLFPALNEMLADAMLAPIGPPGSRLIYLHEVRAVSEETMEISFRDLVGYQGEWGAPMLVGREEAKDLIPHCVAVLWPDQRLPLRLDPLLRYRETDLDAEVLFLNRDHDARQVEYLSYTTGRTERDAAMERAMARLLSLITAQPMTEERLEELEEQSLTATPPEETAPEPPPAPVVQLGDYEILAEIGRGGMGVVYLARQLSLGRLVALKMLPDTLARDPVALARFQREMCALASCDHPNIMKVLTNGTMPDGRLYYTMEYVPGADLEQIWSELAGQTGTAPAACLGSTTFAHAVHTASGKQRQATASRYQSGASAGAAPPSGQSVPPATETHDKTSEVDPHIPRLPLPPLPPLPSMTEDPGSYVRCIATLMRDVALALQAVHDQGILHRDVKPANLMLTPDGSRIVLMDFGLAKGQDTTLAASRQGGLLGTLRYAAPEQLAYPRVEVSPATDVYGLGVTMWELLTRHRLFQDAEDEKQLAMLMHESDVPPVRTVDPSLDRDLDAIVARATERRVSDRIKTAGQLAEYLQLYLDGKPLPFLQPSIPEKCWRWVRRHRRAVAASCVGVVLLSAAAAGVWYWDAYVRPHVAYYARDRDRNGELEGVGYVSASVARHRAFTQKMHRQGRRGPLTKIEYVNGSGTCPLLFHSGTGRTKIADQAFKVNKASSRVIENIAEIFGQAKVCSITFERDAQGRVIVRRAYNRDGKLEYEEHVDPDRDIVYYKDTEGNTRLFGNAGASMVRYTRFTTGPHAGLIREARYTDHENRPRPDADGSYGTRDTYDERGVPVQGIALGADGTPQKSSTLGYAGVGEITYDDLGNITAMSWVDERGQPIMNKFGFAKTTMVYDKYGNRIQQAWYDLAGQLVMAVFGFAKATLVYDAHGNMIEQMNFGSDDRLILNPIGFAKQTLAYDAQGRITEAAFFDTDGHPVVSKFGSARSTVAYDTQGRMIETAYWGPDGRLMLHEQQGLAKLKVAYDDSGKVLEGAFFGTDGQLLLNPQTGFMKTTRQYDAQGNLTEVTYWGTDAKPVLNDKAGCAKMTYVYNARGKQTEVVCYAPDGRLLLSNKTGYAKMTQAYDPQGNLIEDAFWDPYGILILNDKEGYAKKKVAYNARSQRIEEAYFGPNDQLLLNKKWGFARMTLAYDPQGNHVEIAHFGPDGQAVVADIGYAKATWGYNAQGKVSEQAYFGPDGRPMISTLTGYARRTLTHNAQGNPSEERYWGPDDRPMLRKHQYAKVTFHYDTAGELVKAILWDLDGKELPPVEVTVVAVAPDGQAAKLGVQAGDIITGYDGDEVPNSFVLQARVDAKGRKYRTLEIRRHGETMHFEVKPGELGVTLEDKSLGALSASEG